MYKTLKKALCYVSSIMFVFCGVLLIGNYNTANYESCSQYVDDFLAGGVGLTDADIIEVVESGRASAGAIELVLNNGRCLGYVQRWKDMGLIPQDFYPAGSAPAASAPAATPSTSASTPAASSSQAATTTTETKVPEVTEETKTGTFVSTEDVTVYTSKDMTEELGTLPAGTPVSVMAATSNGLYKFPYEDQGDGYATGEAFVTTADYDAAWEETDRVEPTCSEPGEVVRTNSITGLTETEEIPVIDHVYEITDQVDATCTEDGTIVYTCTICGDSYEEAIPALGHDDGEWIIVKAAEPFTTGLKELQCTRCNEVLDSEVLPQTFPLPLWAVILIGAGTAGAVVVIVVIARKKTSAK